MWYITSILGKVKNTGCNYCAEIELWNYGFSFMSDSMLRCDVGGDCDYKFDIYDLNKHDIVAFDKVLELRNNNELYGSEFNGKFRTLALREPLCCLVSYLKPISDDLCIIAHEKLLLALKLGHKFNHVDTHISINDVDFILTGISWEKFKALVGKCELLGVL